MVGVVEWLEREVRLAGVDLRLDSPVSADDVLACGPDVVVVATGGWPDTDVMPAGAEGANLVVSAADVVAGSFPVGAGARTLVFDDHGNIAALSCVEYLLDRGASVSLITPDRAVGHELDGTLHPAFLERFHRDGVDLVPDHRLVTVRRSGGGLEAVLRNVYTGMEHGHETDLVVIEHGVVPESGLFDDLVPLSANGGVLDVDALVELRPQPAADGGFRLYRIGDALAGRDIHAAIYDARRLCQVL